MTIFTILQEFSQRDKSFWDWRGTRVENTTPAEAADQTVLLATTIMEADLPVSVSRMRGFPSQDSTPKKRLSVNKCLFSWAGSICHMSEIVNIFYKCNITIIRGYIICVQFTWTLKISPVVDTCFFMEKYDLKVLSHFLQHNEWILLFISSIFEKRSVIFTGKSNFKF